MSENQARLVKLEASLERALADIRQQMQSGFAEVNARFDALEVRLDLDESLDSAPGGLGHGECKMAEYCDRFVRRERKSD
jgi:hypothetical protein